MDVCEAPLEPKKQPQEVQRPNFVHRSITGNLLLYGDQPEETFLCCLALDLQGKKQRMFGRLLGCIPGGSLDGLRLHASAPVGLTGEGYAQVSFGLVERS